MRGMVYSTKRKKNRGYKIKSRGKGAILKIIGES